MSFYLTDETAVNDEVFFRLFSLDSTANSSLSFNLLVFVLIRDSDFFLEAEEGLPKI